MPAVSRGRLAWGTFACESRRHRPFPEPSGGEPIGRSAEQSVSGHRKHCSLLTFTASSVGRSCLRY